jgi:hypothetical protein
MLQKVLIGLGLAAATKLFVIVINVQSPGARTDIATDRPPSPPSSIDSSTGSSHSPVQSTNKAGRSQPVEPITDVTQIEKDPKDIEGADTPTLKPEEEGFQHKIRIVTYPKH